MPNERLRVRALRKEDFLDLTFEFVNLKVEDAPPGLVRTVENQPSFVVVHFPPQHMAEAVFGDEVTPDAPPVHMALAGSSRLVFRLPDAQDRLPLTLDALLNWEAWELMVAPTALPRDAAPPADIPLPAPPGELETAIEFPWRLLLSPDGTARWRHDRSPFALDGNLQLWRTHLARSVVRPDGQTDVHDGADLRAIAQREAGDLPFVTSLTARDRREIVQLTSNFKIPLPPGFGGPSYLPRPIQAESLSLSTLGASASLKSEWAFPLLSPEQFAQLGVAPLGLQEYRHVAAQGRDHFVRTVNVGFLCGTGNRATIIVTTERAVSGIAQVGSVPGGALFGTKAYLRQSFEVVVQEPQIDYGALASAYAFGGREMPLRSIRLLTHSARIVVEPGFDFSRPIWLMASAGHPLRFRATAVDFSGNTLNFELPLMFVPIEVLGNHQQIRVAFDNPPPELGSNAFRISLGSQPLTMAPADEKPGSTTLKSEAVVYDIEQPAGFDAEAPLNVSALPSTYLPRFLPRIKRVDASVPAVEELLGSTQTQSMAFDPLYLHHGFDLGGNLPQAFVRFDNELPLQFGAQRGGGLARPSSEAKALSRTLGPIAAPDQLAAGKVDLTAFGSAKFLGTISLTEIIAPNLNFDAASAGAEAPTQAQLDDPHFRLNAPRLVTRRLPDGAAIPTSVETRFIWKPPLQTKEFGILTLKLQDADLLMDARTTRTTAGEGPTVVVGRLRNAELSFKDAISVHFAELLFRAEAGRKLEVGAKQATLLFGGPLNFINSLQSILPSDGFDDPPFLTVDGQGVVAGYTLGVPSIGVGIFSIQNIALTAALSIPFTDRPAGVRFAVSERHKPFLLTVSLFGGGGFFAMAVSARGLEQVEASLEFGGNIALNLGIASGGVYVMAGIYFGLTATSVTLTGYLRCGGYLEVLGLISISLEFYLAFTYRKKAGQGSEVWGQASLTVCVKIAFFSKSVSLSVERHFAGADGDPTFVQTTSTQAWAEYLLAFAQ